MAEEKYPDLFLIFTGLLETRTSPDPIPTVNRVKVAPLAPDSDFLDKMLTFFWEYDELGTKKVSESDAATEVEGLVDGLAILIVPDWDFCAGAVVHRVF